MSIELRAHVEGSGDSSEVMAEVDAILDSDWPGLRAAYEAWLAPANFDAAGRQKQSLGALTAPFVAVKNPET